MATETVGDQAPRPKRFHILRILILACTLILIAAIGGIGLYCRQLSQQVDERFSSRRWHLPSKVFSDTTLLFPGQQLDVASFREKLLRMGYRLVSEAPGRRGEIQILPDAIHVFLQDLETPWQKRVGFPASIALAQNTILSLSRHDNGMLLPLLEIEPEEITLFFGPERERRQLVSIDQVPQHVVHAVLAAEDQRFFQHRGLDPRGIMRALVTNLRHGRIQQGGSTITQQLAKSYFLQPERSLKRKLQEALLALTIEVKLSKKVILEIYLNEIYLGQNGSVAINGIGEASHFYFDKPVEALSITEAAAIAGLIKAPNLYSPYVDPAACQRRKNQVLALMHKNEWLTASTLQKEQTLVVKPVGYAVYGNKAPYFVDYLSQQLAALYQPADLSALGLSIYTTLDTQVQAAAENALENGLQRIEAQNPDLKRGPAQGNLQGAVVVMQPQTGHILAMVGGRNYNESQFNRITQARRQAGSAFKPFVFAAGLDLFTPISLLSNQPRPYRVDGQDWKPKNYTPDAPALVTVRQALENSHNLATIDLAMQVGLPQIVSSVSELGFSTPLKAFPSLALGAFEVIPLELARAYSVFAAGGIAAHPLALKAVVDETGQRLAQRHLSIERKISPQKAFIINTLLRGVVKNGTARSLRENGIDWPVAGKTGTTNNYRDAWFIGYTPDLLALVWVGFDDGDSIQSSGSAAALPIWIELVKAIPQHISRNAFPLPRGIISRTLCDEDGQPVLVQNCEQPYNEYFLADNMPEIPVSQKDKGNPIKRFFKGIASIFKGK
jgi:penicillin-binding protein 1B